MKGRDSGMPEKEYWNSFFDAECVVRKLFGEEGCPANVVEFGSGYGTFTLPAARHTLGTVYAFDIEPELISELQERAKCDFIPNISAETRDFVAVGTGLASGSQCHAMLYNLMHIEYPDKILSEALRILRPGGKLSVIHWRCDIPTPRST